MRSSTSTRSASPRTDAGRPDARRADVIRAAAALVMLTTLSVVSSGCYTGRAPLEACCANLRNQHLAKQAWCARSGCYDQFEDCLCDFKRGFKHGYTDAIEGRDTHAPAIAPRRYHGLMYQGAAGNCCEAAWFDGWEHGKVAALQDGVAGLYTVDLRCPCDNCAKGMPHALGGPMTGPGAPGYDIHGDPGPYAPREMPTHTVVPLPTPSPALPLAPLNAPSVLPQSAEVSGPSKVPAVPSVLPAASESDAEADLSAPLGDTESLSLPDLSD